MSDGLVKLVLAMGAAPAPGVNPYVQLIPIALVFAIFYFAVIPAEEQFLRKTFGRQYEEYCENVPRLRPRLTPWPGAEKRTFDWKPALGEWRVASAIMAILVFFTLTSLVWN